MVVPTTVVVNNGPQTSSSSVTVNAPESPGGVILTAVDVGPHVALGPMFVCSTMLVKSWGASFTSTGTSLVSFVAEAPI